ncbi:MAG: GTPase HflX [candidate division KSB1 bacterium]|nr:GTPase HflX [candidate division KSB1 bacterium]
MDKTVIEHREQAIIVGMVRPDQDRHQVNEYLDELELLADTAGALVIERVVQSRQKINPAYMLGRGKVQELAQMAKYLDADLVIFDDDLSPAQVKNIESLIKVKLLDRSGLILDIFAKHARTRESRTQVELAQLNYMLPRLTRQWTHLSRQAGGIGTRGPGETQLEVDRRFIRKRIAHLEAELEKIAKQRDNRRKQRRNNFKAALVGYTNAGKSTILNELTKAGVLVEDRLFATLDSTVRALEFSDQEKMLLIDTVGFIRKLPHHLVASFKSTLEEVRDSDLLLHVVDISSYEFAEQMKTVHDVLKELEAGEKPRIYVFNKLDLLNDRSVIEEVKREYPDSVFIAAGRGLFLDRLKDKLSEWVQEQSREITVEIPLHQSRLMAKMHDLAQVLDVRYTEEHAIMNLVANQTNAARIERMLEAQN